MESNSTEDADAVDSEFLETLWPLLLEDSPCRVESESVDYLKPRKAFDQLHWHELLSHVGYPNYELPQDLRCHRDGDAAEEAAAEQAANQAATELTTTTAALAAYRGTPREPIKPIDEQLQQLHGEQLRRQKLAYDFANRKYPWTMQTPSHELGFEVTPALRAAFRCPMQLEILQAISNYNCKLMLIDAGNEICVEDLKRWIKFRPYAQLLVMLRCPRVERHVQLLKVFETLLVEEDAMNTWHQQLQSSLCQGLKAAKQREMIKSSADAFVFIFSRYRGICTCDTFKILRRN